MDTPVRKIAKHMEVFSLPAQKGCKKLKVIVLVHVHVMETYSGSRSITPLIPNLVANWR